MLRRPLQVTLVILFTMSVSYGQVLDAELYRTYSGQYNNPNNPDWGAAGTDLLQVTPIGFADGIESPAGPSRPNPRLISNDMFSQPGLINDPLSLSDFCWVWGQFIDHDIGITPDGPEPLIIPVPAGDPHFDPFGGGVAIIPMHRNIFNAASGTGAGNPRRYPNLITAFIDGSGVYGSDEERANWLRTFEGGKLKTSTGELLPFNTTTGEFDAPIDPDAPHMDNATGISDVVFVAGDVRASENPLLLSFHVLFVREHNRQSDLLAQRYPEWTDEELYQHARKLVGGMIQSIVYDEWLPAMGVTLDSYVGFDASVNPQLMNVFTAAAFRMGHTLLNSTIRRVDGEGNEIPQGHMALQDAFFNPFAVFETGGIEPFLQGMGEQVQQSFDTKVIDDVRNFLFGQPGFGGLDLASININRGRERGLSDFNAVRQAFGLAPYQFFQQINPNAAVFTRLLTLYADLNDIDPWVGMLAENSLPGSLFGPTVHAIMIRQFTALRDGDRFYYQNDPVLTDEEKAYIHAITLRDVIMYNSEVSLMQDNVFGAMNHQDICDNMTFDVTGFVRTEFGEAVSGVDLDLLLTANNTNLANELDGSYFFEDVPYCELESLTPIRDDNPVNGVSTFDILLVQKHILGIQFLNSPYKIIAADVDANGSITTLDLIRMRKVILGVDTSFEGNTSWRFIWGGYEFLDPSNPLDEPFPEVLDFATTNISDLTAGFIAVKVGDVNGSASPALLSGAPMAVSMEETGLLLQMEDQIVEANKNYWLDLQLAPQATLQGYQFALIWEDLEVLAVESSLPSACYSLEEDHLRVSWHNAKASQREASYLRLRVRAGTAGRASELIFLDRSFTAEAYNSRHYIYDVSLQTSFEQESVTLSQNQPNPFNGQTVIPFYLPEDGWAHLSLLDVHGRTVHQEQMWLTAGPHEWQLGAEKFVGPGVYWYRLQTAGTTQVKSLIHQ